MATILLQVAGAAIGSLLGPVGSAIGAAASARWRAIQSTRR